MLLLLLLDFNTWARSNDNLAPQQIGTTTIRYSQNITQLNLPWDPIKSAFRY